MRRKAKEVAWSDAVMLSILKVKIKFRVLGNAYLTDSSALFIVFLAVHCPLRSVFRSLLVECIAQPVQTFVQPLS
jgi:hypothetical protein